jgi:hypothetical protein
MKRGPKQKARKLLLVAQFSDGPMSMPLEKAVEQLESQRRRLKEYEAVEAATRQDEQWRQKTKLRDARRKQAEEQANDTRDKVRAREKELRAEGKPERAITKTITLELGLDRKTVEKYRTKPK